MVLKLDGIETILDMITKECYYKHLERLIKDGLISNEDLEIFYKDASELIVEIPSVRLHSCKKTVIKKRYKIEVNIFIGLAEDNEDIE